MIVSLYNLLEILSILLCISYLYNQKFKLDVPTVSVIVADIVLIQIIKWAHLPSEFSLVFYLVIFFYCIKQYGFELTKIIINMTITIIIIFALQCSFFLIYMVITQENRIGNKGFIVVNTVLLLCIRLFISRLKINKISKYLQYKGKLIGLSILFCATIIFVCLNFSKSQDVYILENIVMVSICVVLVCILAVNLAKYRMKAIEAETELKIHKLYEDSYKSLIESIRLRQHEFDNHINTIYSQHYVCKTYEELVKAQESYCSRIEKDNYINKLLSSGNSVMIGFLYGKFLSIEKQNLNLTYDICIQNLQSKLPVYKMVEIFGNLIDNATEALETSDKYKDIGISLVETDQNICMEVKNQSNAIDYDEIEKFFKKGYSKKGNNRGLGLYNVKRICEESGIDIVCENIELDGKNWISFKLTISK